MVLAKKNLKQECSYYYGSNQCAQNFKKKILPGGTAQSVIQVGYSWMFYVFLHQSAFTCGRCVSQVALTFTVMIMCLFEVLINVTESVLIQQIFLIQKVD